PPAGRRPRTRTGRPDAGWRTARSRVFVPGPLHARLIVPEALGRFFAQIAPDLRHVVAEVVAADNLGGARARQLDLDNALGAARAVGHHQNAVGKLHRLGQIVRDQ